MHLMACHFIKALNIPSLAHVKQQLHGKGKEAEVEEAEVSDSEDDDELDIDTNLEVEASADDADALHEASATNFEPGDVVGKMMAFIAQLCSCGEDTRDYLKKLVLKSIWQQLSRDDCNPSRYLSVQEGLSERGKP